MPIVSADRRETDRTRIRIASDLLAPQELPVGVITTALGAVFVFTLMMMEKPR